MKRNGAFTLVEMMVAMVLIALLSVVSRPAVSALTGAGTVNRAIGDLSGALDLARAYAMAQSTYVRVGFCNVPTAADGAQTVVLTLYSRDGTLDASDAEGMASAAWMPAAKPLLLRNLCVNDALGAVNDSTPSATNIPAFVRSVPGVGSVSFTSCIQFDPSGEARVQLSGVSRFIKIGMKRSLGSNSDANPFVVRLAGVSGAITVLRKENL
ncbi:MAG: Tfp pilus assembly protein FimT/FimU [Chthoniobacteraceae bacterium]